MGFKRPFWAHQALEYVLALALLSHVLRVDDGLWPRLLAAGLLINVAVVDGPLGAFRLVTRKQHRVADVLLATGAVVLGVQWWVELSTLTRVVLLGIGVLLSALIPITQWESRPPRWRRTTG